jgi:heptosyltransferase I
MTKVYTNILITKPSSLGDIVLSLPALAALRSSFPDAKISWLIRPEFAPLLEGHPHLNEIIPFDRNYLAKAWYNPGAFKALLKLIRKLRQDKFDLVLDFQGLLRTAVLAWLSGCKNRMGPADGRELAHLFYTHKIEYNSDCIHLVDFYLKMVHAAGAECSEVKFVLPVSEPDAEAAKKLLTNSSIKQGQYVVFVPGSAQLDKCWPAERFAELAKKIIALSHLPIIAVGTNSEKAIMEEINAAIRNMSVIASEAKQSRSSNKEDCFVSQRLPRNDIAGDDSADVTVINLAGRTKLKELVELLRGARLVVSNDTGPGHIAAALGVPLVMIYSWSNPARIAPYGRAECMVAKEPFSRGLTIKSTDPKHSVTNITVDEVFQKAREQLDRYKAHSFTPLPEK